MFTSNRVCYRTAWLSLIAFLPDLRAQADFSCAPFGYHAVLQIAPQRNREASCDRDDRDASRPAVRSRALRALVEPLRQRAAGLVAQPVPRHLDQQRAYPPVALLADSLVGLALAAVVGLRHQPDARTDLAPVVELPPEQLEREA